MNHKISNLAKTLLCLVFYLVTNETDRTIESCFYKLLDAKKECEEWEKMKPQKTFMIIEAEIN
jgi:hypothetical protein